MMERRLSLLLGMFVFATFTISCNSDEPGYKKKLMVDVGPAPQLVFDRYEDVLFHLDTANFQQELIAIQQDYLPFLSGGDLNDPDAIKYLKDFATDNLSLTLYQKVKEAFPDLEEVKGVICGIYQHFQYYYPNIQLPTRVFTCVSGVDLQSSSVMFREGGLVISLDWYLDRDEIYDKIGIPKYRSERTSLMHLAKDLGQLFYATYVQQTHRQTNLLEEMVDAGRMNYFIEAMCPSIPDEALLGYTSEQLRWAESNEGKLWADIVGCQKVYSSDYKVFKMFFADGPFTNDISHDAPARMGEFLGLHIVREYMGSHDMTLQDLMKATDLQGIFQDSGYRPKK